MIDHEIIRQSTKHSLSSLQQRKSTDAAGLYLLNNFLDPILSDRVLEYLNLDYINWIDEFNQSGEYRKKVNWIPDSPVEELHTVISLMTDSINQIFNRNNKFSGITIWRDYAGFAIKPHTDNLMIDIAMQIYLTGDINANAGTTFIINDHHIQLPYQKNLGYLMDNRAKIKHYMTGTIPDNHVRYSLYALWMSK